MTHKNYNNNEKSVFIKPQQYEYEVELRTKGNLENKIKNVFGIVPENKIYCVDSYIKYDKNTGFIHRLRKINKNENIKYFEMFKYPTTHKGHLLETEPEILTQKQYEKKIKENNLIVIVEGSRKQIKYNGLSFCFDDILNLGEWTEFEKIIYDKNKIKKTEGELIEIANSLGIKKNKLLKKPYPQMILEKNARSNNY
ncbi:MAG: hypothetical protein ACOC3X_01795 [Nanoarchaeota archaeon]